MPLCVRACAVYMDFELIMMIIAATSAGISVSTLEDTAALLLLLVPVALAVLLPLPVPVLLPPLVPVLLLEVAGAATLNTMGSNEIAWIKSPASLSPIATQVTLPD